MKQLRFLLGISGGIAAFKIGTLIRLLIKEGHVVQVVMTKSATHFVAPATFQSLSQQPVYTDIWQAQHQDNMAHIACTRSSEAIIIAPATANIIAKIANGIADDLLSTLCAARHCPLIIVPAMNKEMWDNPANKRNINFLKQQNVQILGPDLGEQACGEYGEGRMLEPLHIFNLICAQFQEKKLQGLRILLTAGPTYERIDAVRGITNTSSGKMGYALASVAQAMGAIVTLVSGPTTLDTPLNCTRIDVENAQQMHKAVMAHIPSTDIFIGVAAVADYCVINPQTQKIKKEMHSHLILQLAKNPDILHEVSTGSNPPFCVGFAMESEHLIEYARAKRIAKKLPLLIANSTSAMGHHDNEVILLDDTGEHVLAKQSKTQLAIHIMQHIAKIYKK